MVSVPSAISAVWATPLEGSIAALGTVMAAAQMSFRALLCYVRCESGASLTINFWFVGNTRHAQGFLLGLCSAVIPGGTQGIMRAED